MKEETMKVFVTGATGAVGRFVVPRLAARHEVTALARTPEKATTLAAAGAKAAEVSIFDPEELAAAFAGHDVVLNLATAIPPPNKALQTPAWAENNRIRTEGSTAVVDAALAAGVGQVVQESIIFPYPDSGDRWIDEEVALDPVAALRSTVVAESNAQRFTDAGRDGVVLRFGAFYGPGSSQSDQILDAARRHIGLAIGRPSGYISSIHVDDAAAAAVAAIGVASGIYNVVDDEPLTKREFARAVGDAVDTKPWFLTPGRVARLGGNRTAALTRSQRVTNRRFRDATGWAPRFASAREGWAATVAAQVPEQSRA